MDKMIQILVEINTDSHLETKTNSIHLSSKKRNINIINKWVIK